VIGNEARCGCEFCREASLRSYVPSRGLAHFVDQTGTISIAVTNCGGLCAEVALAVEPG